MYPSRRQFLLSAVSAACALRAQDDATFKTEIKVVNVLASVRTKKGEIVRDLTKDDFSIIEDGRPQTIKYFARQSDLPLTLGLMVDTSMSQRRVLESERTASFRFLDQVLREAKDQVFIMQFDTSVILRQGLTSSFGKLNDALSYIDMPSRNEMQIGGSKGTVLYDAVVKASNEIMKKQSGRKALLLLTDGVDVGSDATRGGCGGSGPARRHADLFHPVRRFGLLLVRRRRRVARAAFEWPGKPAAVSMKFRRNTASIKSTPPLKTSCAANTASDIIPTSRCGSRSFARSSCR